MINKLLSMAIGAASVALLSTGAFAAPSQSVFTLAGLGNKSDWTNISPEVFGSGSSNGYLATGGTVTVELRLADYGNSFGTSFTNHGGRTTILTAADGIGASATFSAPASQYLFFFEASGDLADSGRVYSDNTRDEFWPYELDMFIYEKDGEFAFFFDDGGPSGICHIIFPCDDNDANDLVVLVQVAAVPEPASLALFGAALAGLGLARRRKSA